MEMLVLFTFYFRLFVCFYKKYVDNFGYLLLSSFSLLHSF